MATYRVTLMLGQSNMGWSESYYYTASSASALAAPLTEFLNYRAALLTNIHQFDGVRLSIEGDHRKSKLMTNGPNQITPSVVITVPPQGTFPTGQTPLKYDQVRACVQTILAKDGINIGLRYFDGVPDELTATENATLNFGNPPEWWSRWKQFQNIWIARGWAIRLLDKTGANPEKPIIAWVLRATEPNVLGFVTNNVAPLALSIGDKVNVRGVRNKFTGIRTPNGTWVVDQVVDGPGIDAVTVYLRGATAFDPANIKTLGFARKVIYQYVVPDVIESVRAGIHKRGKRFGTPRGRSRVIHYANS